MKKLEKIALGLMVLLGCLTFITWTIGVIWHAPNGSTVNNIFDFLTLGTVIVFTVFFCALFYNVEIKEKIKVMVQYRIIENNWVDSHGKSFTGSTHYTIMYKRKFLFWDYWETVKHVVENPDCSEIERLHGATGKLVPTKFNSLLEAKEFAENYVAKGIETNRWVNNIVLSNELQ